MLEMAVLGLLKERPMHGYELRKQLAASLGLFWTVSFGSLYPTLRRLERQGAIEMLACDQQSYRRKQAYRITETGERLFLRLIEGGATTSWEEEKFPLRLVFFRYLRPETRLRLLQRRKDYLLERLDDAGQRLRQASGGRADTYLLSLLRHGIRSTENEIQLLDELIKAERVLVAGEVAGEDPLPPDTTSEPRTERVPGMTST